jgi:histidinol phosphatase-like enzyme (inositol monophosphatase family)
MVAETQIARFLAFADTLADAARAAILPHFRANAPAEAKQGSKHGFDPVTVADRDAEHSIRRLIDANFPEHGIVGEEFGEKASRSAFTWIVDPIDGTRAFLAGLPLWGVLIALAYEGKPIIGVIDQPYIGERFRGWPGGASLVARNGERPLRTRTCERLTEAVIATTDPKLFEPAEAAAFEQVRAAAKITRYGCDCYAYAMIALGSVDLVIESGLAPWDVAALVPVVEGAGGRVTDWRGAPIPNEWFVGATGRAQVAACGDARVCDEALIALRRSHAPRDS